MLSSSETLRICRKVEKVLRPVLGIGPEWNIYWRPRDDDDDGPRGMCSTQAEYRRADIRIYHVRCGSADEVVETAAHELIHVSQWPFDILHSLLADPESETRIHGMAWDQAFEQHVALTMQSQPVKVVIQQLQREVRTMKR